MSWLFSRALVAAFSEEKFSDGELSVPLKSIPMRRAYSLLGKTTDFSRLSRFGMTFGHLTESLGAALLTWFLAGFPVRTSAPQDEDRGSKASDPDCGWKWPGSSVKYDPSSRSWKTRQYSLLGGLAEFSETWPRWGLMRDGECWELPTLERRISGTESGLWPTPTRSDGAGGPGNSGRAGGVKLRTAVVEFATPTQRDYKSGKFSPDAQAKREEHSRGKPLNEQIGGQLNPTWVEWLMGWPPGWTDLRPLATDRCRSAQQQPG